MLKIEPKIEWAQRFELKPECMWALLYLGKGVDMNKNFGRQGLGQFIKC